MVTTKVYCTLDVVGFHRWPKAPVAVKYLRSVHRHVFKFKITISVNNLDRQIEFHTLKGLVLQQIKNDSIAYYPAADVSSLERESLDFGINSCEQLAEKLLYALLDKYESNFLSTSLQFIVDGNSTIEVEVSEDGENGGIALYTPDEIK